MGNPAWGNGYHKGFGDGAKQGGIVGSLITLGATALVGGGVWVVGKLRDRSMAKQVLDAAATEAPADGDQEQPADSAD
ncbi:hypothetical protein [Arthrobacter sp. CAN_A1]|uniref:hypothetical protein n=1 Tax=Arthrobacter sp. CAN_A1 TaxID=2787717 RepID=UPI0018CB7ED4